MEGQTAIRKDGSHGHLAATLAAEVPRALASVVSQAHLCPLGWSPAESVVQPLPPTPAPTAVLPSLPPPWGGHQPSSSLWSFPPNAPHITLTRGLQGWGRKQGPCSSQPGSALQCWAHNHPNGPAYANSFICEAGLSWGYLQDWQDKATDLPSPHSHPSSYTLFLPHQGFSLDFHAPHSSHWDQQTRRIQRQN